MFFVRILTKQLSVYAGEAGNGPFHAEHIYLRLARISYQLKGRSAGAAALGAKIQIVRSRSEAIDASWFKMGPLGQQE